jgi:membrane protease YdiL (CAAX protease family)
MMAGPIFGALFRRTGSVWRSTLLRAVYNGLHYVASTMS